MLLELKNIDKSFGEKKVLKGVSFVAESGKAFGLLGRNGAGKTTSIRILMNVFPADAGEVLTDGKPIDYDKISLGYLPEERGLYPKKLIIDQLVYFAELKGMKRTDAVQSVDRWLKRLELYEYRNKRLDTLSKGNQQKIQLITALAHDPQIVLFSSHQMSYIEEFCDSIAILNAGKVVLHGDLREIKRNYVRDRLVVRTDNPEQIKADFKDDCTVQEDGSLILRLASPNDKQTAMKHLAEKYDIDEIKVFEPSLNDIFVEYAVEQE